MRVAGTGAGWRDAAYVCLDLETTSADPRSAEPLSVGWVRVEQGRVVLGSAGYALVSHDGPLPAGSGAVHRLLPTELAEGDPVEEVATRVARQLAPDPGGGARAGARPVLVAHGADLERAVLTRLLGRGALDGVAVLDTLVAVRRLDARAGEGRADPRLGAAARRWGVPPATAHHALGDALTTALLLVSLAGREEAARERAGRGRLTVDDLLRLGAA